MDEFFEQLRADIEIGTPEPWIEGQSGNLRVYGPDGRGKHSGLVFDVKTGSTYKGRVNTRRIARVPHLEAIALAAKELAARAEATLQDHYDERLNQALFQFDQAVRGVGK